MQLAGVLGIHDKTLYRWEADGFFKAHTDTAALVLRWLIGLEEQELERWSRAIRGKLATNHVIECQLELHLAVLAAHKRKSSPAGSPVAPPQVATRRCRGG